MSLEETELACEKLAQSINSTSAVKVPIKCRQARVEFTFHGEALTVLSSSRVSRIDPFLALNRYFSKRSYGVSVIITIDTHTHTHNALRLKRRSCRERGYTYSRDETAKNFARMQHVRIGRFVRGGSFDNDSVLSLTPPVALVVVNLSGGSVDIGVKKNGYCRTMQRPRDSRQRAPLSRNTFNYGSRE